MDSQKYSPKEEAISSIDTFRWEVVGGFQLHWRRWDGETVVYQDGSGETHLLGPIETAVLRRVEEKPATRDELAAHLEDVLEATPGPTLFAYIDKLLDRFFGLGLIEPLNQLESR